jgi:hypothetical protein
MQQELIAVTGAGGFIGGALIAEFRRQGYPNLGAIDIKPPDEWYLCFDDVENLSLDLNLKENCERAAAGQIYNLAASMGGMGFIEHNKALCMPEREYAHQEVPELGAEPAVARWDRADLRLDLRPVRGPREAPRRRRR